MTTSLVQRNAGPRSAKVAERGDDDAAGQAVLARGKFERRLLLEILGPCRNGVHSALHLPLLATWRERASPAPRLPVDRDGFPLGFLPSAERSVTREGVRLFNIHDQDGKLAPLIGAGAGRLG